MLGLGARLGALAWSGVVLGADSHGYKAAAEALRASPLTDAERFVSLPPLYPLFLALMPNDIVAGVVQASLGALLAPLLGVAVARHFGTTAGVAAATLAALEPSFIFWGTYLLTDPLALILFATALERTSAVLSSSKARDAIFAGVAAGATVITRAALALPALVLAAWLVGQRGRGWMLGGAFGLGLALVLIMPVARNVAATGHTFLYHDQGWFLLWAGTRWNEVGRGTGGVDIVVPPDVADLSREQQNEYFRSEFLSFVAARPLDYAGLMARKALWFWLPAYPEWSLRHRLAGFAYFSLLYVLAGVGVAVARTSRLTWLLLGCLAAIQLTTMLTIVDYDARYRLPAELCLVALAGAGGAALWGSMLRSRRASRSRMTPSRV